VGLIAYPDGERTMARLAGPGVAPSAARAHSQRAGTGLRRRRARLGELLGFRVHGHPDGLYREL
jgi:hypothetical protein